MSDIKQEIFFVNSGLNTDDDMRYMASGDAVYKLNILVNEDGSGGTITNMLGNSRTVDISDHELNLSHCYFVLGSYYNRLTRRVYYFIFSQPYEIPSEGSTTTTTTTTTYAPWDFDIDYTSGDFEYDNRLIVYYEDTQTIDVIFIDTRNYFGLHPNYSMRDMCMIGNYLYFNPRVSEPKVIEVDMAYNYTNYNKYSALLPYVYGDYVTYYGGLFRANTLVLVGETPVTHTTKWDRVGDSYQNETTLSFDSEFRYAFNVIKQPPAIRPSIAYGTDTTINSNNVRGKMFRFSYRYKYFDNSYSVYSAYSDVTLPKDDETWNGEIMEDVNGNNYIAVTVGLHSAALIKTVEIIFQVIGENWRRCKIINRIEQDELTTNNFTYNFYNNEAHEVYSDDSIVVKVYDSVPSLADSEEIINKNILCYGGVAEGFDNLDKDKIDVTLTPEVEDITEIFDEVTLRRDNIISGDYREEEGAVDDSDPYSQRTYYFVLEVFNYLAWGVQNGDVYRIVVEGEEGTVALGAGNVDTVSHLVNAIAYAVRGSFIWVDISHMALGELWIGRYNSPPNVSISRFYDPSATATALSKHRGFKTGAFHPFCQFYYDASLRRMDAQTSKISENTVGYTYVGTTVYIPMFNEISPVADSSNRWIINWTVNHLPPEDAKYWRWGYAGNSLCSFFVQYIIHDIDNVATEGGYMTVIDISPLQTLKYTVAMDGVLYWNQFPASNISPYVWQKGDRIRFLTEKGDPDTPGTDLGASLDGVYDFEIIKQVDADNTIYIQRFGYGALNIGECSLVEIYTPIKEVEKETFYEFGELIPIIKDADGVLVHAGIETDQRYSTNTPATGTFDTGDVYHILRTPSKLLDVADTDQGVFHESMWYSDFYDSDDWDKGKAGTESNFNRRHLNIIRFSNPYFQNTQINGLPTFEADSYKELNDVFGNIVAIYENGDTLKVYQERKASSIQIGRTEYTDTLGNTSVALSTSTLGSIRYSPSNYSTVFPESINRNNKFIYGFDIYNGIMWRDGVNGIFPISGRYAEAGMDTDYKMATYFKDKSKALLVSGIDHCDVLSVWDEEFKNLHVVFKDYVLEENNETVVFHEPSNRWICFENLDQTPINGYNVMIELTYDIVKGFEGGLGYDFDEDTRFAIFDLVTKGNILAYPDIVEMTFEALEPTVTCSTVVVMDLPELTFTALEPTVDISYIIASVSSMSWAYDEYGSSFGINTIITATVGTCTLSYIPLWLIVERGGSILSEGMIITTGQTLTLYPIDENPGLLRDDNVVFIDSKNNLEYIFVIQNV